MPVYMIQLIVYICNSVETAQPGDRTTNPGIVMPECYASSQRVDSLARVVITPDRHTHTRLHIFYFFYFFISAQLVFIHIL